VSRVAQTEGDMGYDYDDAYDELYLDNDLGLHPLRTLCTDFIAVIIRVYNRRHNYVF